VIAPLETVTAPVTSVPLPISFVPPTTPAWTPPQGPALLTPIVVPIGRSTPAAPPVAGPVPAQPAGVVGSNSRTVHHPATTTATSGGPFAQLAPVRAAPTSSDVPATATARSRTAGAAAPNGYSPEQLSVAPGGVASSGSGTSMFFAVLMSLLALAAICFSKLRVAPAAWRSVAVVSLIERPG